MLCARVKVERNQPTSFFLMCIFIHSWFSFYKSNNADNQKCSPDHYTNLSNIFQFNYHLFKSHLLKYKMMYWQHFLENKILPAEAIAYCQLIGFCCYLSTYLFIHLHFLLCSGKARCLKTSDFHEQWVQENLLRNWRCLPLQKVFKMFWSRRTIK